mmetsp:Transcript_47099/g.121721  ORF Transcript_47099/g.121721 Transcript_47099/m.121721 type:complete len:265 (+) Transcript_47099:1830-2624(+)
MRRKGCRLLPLDGPQNVERQIPVVIAQEHAQVSEYVGKVFGEVLSRDNFFDEGVPLSMRQEHLDLLDAGLGVATQASRQAFAHLVHISPGHPNGKRHDQGVKGEQLLAPRGRVEGSPLHALPQTGVGAGAHGVQVTLATQLLALLFSVVQVRDDVEGFPLFEEKGGDHQSVFEVLVVLEQAQELTQQLDFPQTQQMKGRTQVHLDRGKARRALGFLGVHEGLVHLSPPRLGDRSGNQNVPPHAVNMVPLGAESRALFPALLWKP